MILRHEGVTRASLSVVFVSHQKIKALNKKFLHRDYGTDVLAFDSSDRGLTRQKNKRKPKSITGDIIISTDAAHKNAKVYDTTIAKELTLYVIHGVLHLLGYEDHKTQDIKKIRKREHEILKYLGAKIDSVVSGKG